MSKRRSHKPKQTAKVSPIQLTIAKLGLTGTIVAALIGAIGVVTAAYFGYLATKSKETSAPIVIISEDLDLDGKWEGKTSQDGVIAFEVSGNKVTGFMFTVPKIYGLSPSARCPLAGQYFGQEIYIDRNTFVYVTDWSAVPIEIRGEFKSSILAEGLLLPPEEPVLGEECAIFSATWTATKK